MLWGEMGQILTKLKAVASQSDPQFISSSGSGPLASSEVLFFPDTTNVCKNWITNGVRGYPVHDNSIPIIVIRLAVDRTADTFDQEILCLAHAWVAHVLALQHGATRMRVTARGYKNTFHFAVYAESVARNCFGYQSSD